VSEGNRVVEAGRSRYWEGAFGLLLFEEVGEFSNKLEIKERGDA